MTNHRFALHIPFTNTSHRDLNKKLNTMVNPWTAIKRRFTAKNAKAIRNKAFAGTKLIAAGAALTGRAMLLKEAATPKRTPFAGHDNVYATDNWASLFKVEALAGQEDSKITTSEIIGYVILIQVFLMILLFIMLLAQSLKSNRYMAKTQVHLI